MIRLLIAEIAENAGRDLDVEKAILGDDIQVFRHAWHGDLPALVADCEDADVILTDFVPFSAEVLSPLRRCRLISVAATGFSCVDIEAAKVAGISVCVIDEYCTEEVADHTLTLILALSRRLLDYDRLVQHDKRWLFDALAGLSRLKGATLGIVGLGRIGRAVAKRAAAFGLRVVAHDPYVNATLASESNVRLCTLDDLYNESNIISLHCNLSDGNHRLIDAAAFEKMRKRPILINVARGDLIDEAALVDALDEGRVSAAGLDVLSNESPDLESSPLMGRNNVILTPHVAFYSDTSMLENRSISAGNIRHFFDGNHEAVRKYVYRAQERTNDPVTSKRVLSK